MATARKTPSQAAASAAAASTALCRVKSQIFVEGEIYRVDDEVELTEEQFESLPRGYVELVRPAD